MAEFDPTEYFSQRAGNSKIADLQQISRQKREALRQITTAGTSQPAAEREAEQNSVVGRLGLDPDGVVGGAVNLVSSAGAGVMKVAGQLLGAVPGALASSNQAKLTEEDIAALNRHAQGQATPEDLQRISRPIAGDDDMFLFGAEEAQRRAAANPKAMTPLSIFQEMNSMRDVSRTLVKEGESFQDRVHQARGREFTEQLGSGFDAPAAQITKGWAAAQAGDRVGGLKDMASGLADLVMHTASTVSDNKQASVEFMAENAPQLFVGAAGKAGSAALTASNAGYALDKYNEGIQAYQAKNSGALPPEADRRRMALQAASLALAEHASDTIGLAASKVVGKAAKDSGRTSLKKVLLGTAGAVTEGGASEAATEAYQTYTEGEITGKPATGAEIYTGGVIGGVAGAGLSGGARGLHETAKLATQPAEPKAPADPDKTKAVQSAIDSGDVSALVDPKAKTYAPDKAIAALFGHSNKEGQTEEAKQANLAKADQIIEDLEERRGNIVQALKTPEQRQADVAAAKARLAQLDAADPRRGVFEAHIQVLTEEAQAEPLNDKKRKAAERDLARVEALLTETTKNYDALNQLVQPAQVDVNEIVKEIDAGDTSRADQAITLAMANPSALAPEVAAKLAGNMGLTEQQRSFLRALSDTRVAENELQDMGGVSATILHGDKKNLGIAQYRARMSQALAINSEAGAKRQLRGINKFAEDHQAKAAAAAQAMKQGLGTQIVRTGDGRWVIPEQELSIPELRKNGGLAVNSPRLVERIGKEANTLTKAAAQLQAAYDLKFTKKEAANVADVSQEGSGKDSQPVAEAAQVRAEPKPGASEPAVDAGAATAAGTAGRVEDAGLGATAATPDSRTSGDSVSSVNQTEQAQKAEKTQESGSSTQKTEKSSVDNQSTAENSTTHVEPKASELADSVEQDTEVADESASEPVQQAGTLIAIQNKSPEGTSFKARNLVGDFFAQTAAKAGDKTQRPLVAVRDFLSNMTSKTVLDYLSIPQLSEKQVKALGLFKKTAVGWREKIKGNLPTKRNPEFFYLDMLQFLVQGEGKDLDLEQNVKTALSYAAFSWIAENAARDSINSDEEINEILDRDEQHPVSQEERAALAHVGTRENVVINTLGQRAAQALGLKALKNAPQDLQPKLESALGAHVLKLLVDEGMIERSILSGSEMAKLTGSENTNTKASFKFVRLLETEQTVEIYDVSRGTQGVLDKLFGVEAGLKEPSHEPIPFTQTKTKNTSQNVPERLAKIIEHENSVASYVRPDMWQLANVVADDILLEIAGAEDLDGKHPARESNLAAKNDGLKREIQRFKDFVGDMVTDGAPDITKPLYFDHIVWKQQRVGIATNAINPQTSKVHRHMLYRKAWDSEVRIDDEVQMENFWLRVAEGLGIKTDKQSNERSMNKVLDLVESPQIVAAVSALEAMLQDPGMTTMPEEQQQALLAGVKMGGEAMHSLDALMALAQYQVAQAAGKESFRTTLMGEVDGVTNGPMLSHLLLGAADTAKDLFSLLNRGGFFEQGNAQNQYNLWREVAGHLDLYETTTRSVLATVRELTTLNPKDKLHVDAGLLDVVYQFTGALEKDGTILKAGRNIIKTPLTAMVFGSAIGKAVDSMADDFVESIYDRIEATLAGKPDAMSQKQLVENINLLLSQSRNAPWIREKDLAREFNAEQVKALKWAFKNTFGKAVKQTMETEFSAFIGTRKQLNQAAQLSFELYNAVYTAMREDLVAELVKSGEIAVNGVGKPIHDLTAQQEAELKKRLRAVTPVMHTLMSKDSGSLSAGLHMSKSGRKLSQKDTYSSEVKFGTKFADNGVGSVTTHGYETVMSAPGVAMAPMSVHSTDSAISHYAADGNEVLNIHDAHGAGLATFEQTARNLNQATWHAMLHYSPASEIYAAMTRTVRGLAALARDGQLPDSAVKNLAEALAKFAAKNDLEPATVLADMVANTKVMAFRADSVKLEALSQMASIDQYALQGGAYTVTEGDREAATAMRAALDEAVNPADREAVDVLTEIINKKEAPKVKAEADPEMDPTPAKQGPSPFGELVQPGQQPYAQPDPVLQAFFEQNPETTAQRVLEGLARHVKDPFQLKLVQMLWKTVAPDTKVTYVTSRTTKGAIYAPQAARGWYVPAWDSNGEVFVLSPEFANSGLTTEVLIHELVHAALYTKMSSPTEAMKPYIEELNALLQLAQERVMSEGLEASFGPAVSNLDEFIAWGMTNKDFQQMVLAKVKAKSSTLGKMASGMQAFVNSLARLLGFKTTEDANGLGVLIANVSGLMEQATKTEKANGPKNVQAVLSMANVAAVDSYSTLEIFDALDNGGVDAAFAGSLRGLLGGIVTKLHGPFGVFAEGMKKTEAGNPMAVWLKAIETGKAPYASQVVASPLASTNQQDFVIEQVEATVRAALNANEAHTKMAYRDLAELYTETYQRLKPADFHAGDWSKATANEKRIAQEKFDFVFKLDKDNGDRSDYLARFAALGLANQEFNKLLQVATKRDTRAAPKSFAERLQAVFEDILEFFHEKITHTFRGQDADVKLRALVDQLVDIEAKKRHALKQREIGNAVTEPVEAAVREFTEALRKKAETVMNSDAVRNSGNAFVKAAGGLARTWAGDRTMVYMDSMMKLRDRMVEGRHGIVAGLINEVRGPLDQLKSLLLASKKNERDRKQVITHTAKFVLESFKNGKTMVEEAKRAVSQVFLRTGAHVLLDHFSMADIEKLMSDPSELAKAIGSFESQLTGAFRQYYLHQAKALAYYKVTGEVTSAMLMMNAGNIANMTGTAHASQVNEQQAQAAAPVIEALVALYGLKYTDSVPLVHAVDVLRTENQRTDGNGVEFALRLHKQLEQQSKERLFSAAPALMVHGYTPEIYNPHIEVLTANAVDGKALEEQGYVKGARVANDPHDPDQTPKHLYTLKDGGLQPHLTGIISYTGMKAKGTQKHSGYLNANNQAGLNNASLNADILAKRQAALQRAMTQGASFDPTKAKQGYMAPVLNASGEIVNWRYLMQESTKDTVLKRNNRFEQVLGALAGSIMDKQTSAEQNRTAIEGLHDLWRQEFATESASYFRVGPDSSDAELREVWALLPEATKQAVREVWGQEGLYVRKDSMDIVFGYRKYSAANPFKKAMGEREARKQTGQSTSVYTLESINAFEKVLVGVVESILEARGLDSKRAAVIVAKGERMWQEIVHEAKDIIVVKTGVVLLGNIWSNFSMLHLNGVPFKDMAHHHLVALKGATAYQKDSEELERLRTLLATGYTQGNDQQIRRDILRLEDAIARNPVRELIDAGLMPTIVEDVAAEEDIYSYKSALVRKADKFADKLNPVVVKAARVAYMARDTKLYQGLSRITQLSDFVARYTLYQHLTTRKNDPLSKADAILRASDTFVNYDIPMHRGMQYTDDMGITMFTKYFLRIQKELLRVGRENPARVLSLVALNHYMDLGPIVLEGSALTRIGNNPLEAGAFKLVTSLDDLMTVAAPITLLK